MIAVSVKHYTNKSILEIYNSDDTLIRKVTLIKEHEYVINPINKRTQKNRGRKVILKDIETTRYGPIAKVKYLDTLRTGKVYIADLDINSAEYNHLNAIENSIDDYIYDELVPLFNLFMDILKLMDNKKDEKNLIYISQQEIAKQLSTSPTNVSKKLNQLIRYGAIEKVSSGVYKLLSNSIWHTPYRIVHKVNKLALEHPEINKNYKEQAELLNVSLDDIFQAWSYIHLTQK
jgi:biotin operon repressor